MPSSRHNEIVKATLDGASLCCAPLYWHDSDAPWPRPTRGGTCFFLRFGENTFGVTAAHVMAECLETRRENPKYICQIGASLFDPENALIELDSDLDIATFQINDDLLSEMGRKAISCDTDSWPPPAPKVNDPVVLIGFPESSRECDVGRILSAGIYGALALVEDVTERDVIIVHDRSRDKSTSLAPMPPHRMPLSGCSGGIGLSVKPVKGSFTPHFTPLGIIRSGPASSANGMMDDIEIIRLRRISFVGTNGELNRGHTRPAFI